MNIIYSQSSFVHQIAKESVCMSHTLIRPHQSHAYCALIFECHYNIPETHTDCACANSERCVRAPLHSATIDRCRVTVLQPQAAILYFWEQLVVHDDKHHRQFKSRGDDSTTRTVLSGRGEMHSAASLGEEKTLARLRERFHRPRGW